MKGELLARLRKIAQGLRDQGFPVEAEQLDGVIKYLQKYLSKSATIQEAVVLALTTVVREQITLDGRLVDALAYLAKRYGVVLAMHPVLLIVVAMGGQGNPDRSTPDQSDRLDAVLSALVEDPAPYQESLYALAVLARTAGLTETADLAVDLLKEIHERGATTMAEQAVEIERSYLTPPPTNDDELGWVVQVLLTLASLALVAASATRLAGTLQDFLAGLDELLGELLKPEGP